MQVVCPTHLLPNWSWSFPRPLHCGCLFSFHWCCNAVDDIFPLRLSKDVNTRGRNWFLYFTEMSCCDEAWNAKCHHIHISIRTSQVGKDHISAIICNFKSGQVLVVYLSVSDQVFVRPWHMAILVVPFVWLGGWPNYGKDINVKSAFWHVVSMALLRASSSMSSMPLSLALSNFSLTLRFPVLKHRWTS